jgi:hypothetical protein
MSVTHNTYVLIGLCLLPEEVRALLGDDAFERLEPYTDSAYGPIKHHNGLCVLWGEDYVAIGHVVAKSEAFYALPQPVNPLSALVDHGETVRGNLTRLLGTKTAGPSIWIIGHYR